MNIFPCNLVSTVRASALVLVFALAACSSDTPADTAAAPAETAAATPTTATENTATAGNADDDSIFNMSAIALLQGLFSTPGFSVSSNMGDGQTLRVDFPVIWVFSPDGNITRAVSNPDNLAAFAADFKSTDTEGTQLTCQQLETATQNAVGTDVKVDLGCASGKWIGVLLSVNDSDRCTHCQDFIDTLKQTANAHTDELHTATLFLEM